MTIPIAITCGDPNGIGPEITVKAWKALRQELNFVLFTSYDYMKQSFPEVPMIKIDNPKNANEVMQNGLPIFDFPFLTKYRPNECNVDFSGETIKSIEMATRSCINGETKALCTNPINKHILSEKQNFKYTGHTDFLRHLTKSDNAVMMLASDKLRVIPVTIHVSLANATKSLSIELIENTIEIAHNSLIRLFNITAPRIAVTGLNPHAGENGMFGFEELDIIIPSIQALKRKDIDIRGPFSADSLFHERARKNYDVVICMYHDQALIPIKTISFDEAVNVTLGLPFVRTSPDHGTAEDISGKGIASPLSLINSIRMAEQLTGDIL